MKSKYANARFNIYSIVLPSQQNRGQLYLGYKGGFVIRDFKEGIFSIVLEDDGVRISHQAGSNQYLEAILRAIKPANYKSREPIKQLGYNGPLHKFSEEIQAAVFREPFRFYRDTKSINPEKWGQKPLEEAVDPVHYFISNGKRRKLPANRF